MDPASAYQAYQAVAASYKGGRWAYRTADKRVAAYAREEG